MPYERCRGMLRQAQETSSGLEDGTEQMTVFSRSSAPRALCGPVRAARMRAIVLLVRFYASADVIKTANKYIPVLTIYLCALICSLNSGSAASGSCSCRNILSASFIDTYIPTICRPFT